MLLTEGQFENYTPQFWLSLERMAFPPMLLSMIMVGAQWLPLPVTSFCLCVHVHPCHSACTYMCIWTYLSHGLLLAKKKNSKSFMSIIVMLSYCGIPWTNLLQGFFSYFVNRSVENRVRGGILVWEVVCCVPKAIGNKLLLRSLGRSCLSLCFLVYPLWLRSRSV